MKKLILLILTFACTFCNAQINLVPNPSFEDTVSCPLGGDQLYKAINWYSFRNTPDYFHSCCINVNCGISVPNNIFGYQYPHSGEAYAGMISFDLTGNNYREYLGVNLQYPTIPNQKYYVTFYVSWGATLGFTIAHNKLGVNLSTVSYSQTNPYPISNNPKAFTYNSIIDSIGWSKIQLSFTADSAYNYLILGNFFDNSNTDTLNLGQFNVHSYYYVDDVCLSTDSVYCSDFTTNLKYSNVIKNDLVESYIYKGDRLILNFNEKYKDKIISIYTELGQLIAFKLTDQKSIDIELKNMHNSIVFLNIISDNKFFTKKLFAIKND